MTRIAVIGLGEAGRLYARGFRAAGAAVRGYDLRPRLASGEQVDRLADPRHPGVVRAHPRREARRWHR